MEALRSTPSADHMLDVAERIRQHRFPLLGLEVETGAAIHWRRDYINGKESPADYFRRIPYLDAALVGDHKVIWELNRHQHLVLLAQAHLLTGRRAYLDEIASQLESWFAANPMHRGINWTSALEVAFRSLSWMWVDHLVGPQLGESGRRRLVEGLYQHAAHLEANLSVYFSPNTHLLGEAVALHALGLMFRGVGPALQWEKLGRRIVREQMRRQVRADGSHFEQSSYYHVYALDMFLFHAILDAPPQEYRDRLERMGLYLQALLGAGNSLPFLGDDDGGRFFHPFGSRASFGAATLAACGQFLNRPEWIGCEEELHDLAIWWLQPAARCPPGQPRPQACASVRFADSGVCVLRSGNNHCLVDAGPFGPFRGGHSHADTLSVVATADGQELLIDPGTYTYSGDSPWRGRFRGTAAHNTVRVNGLDQAEPAGSFGWRNPPQVEIREWRSGDGADFLDAACRYRNVRHRRRLFYLKPELLFVLDDIEGHEVEAEQFWHLGSPADSHAAGVFRIGGSGMLLLDQDAAEIAWKGDLGWRSRAYGSKDPSPVIVSRRFGRGSVQLAAVIAFAVRPDAGRLRLTRERGVTTINVGHPWNTTVEFPPSGPCRIDEK